MNELSGKLEEQAYQLSKRLNTHFDQQLKIHQQREHSEQLGPFLYRLARLCHRAQDRYQRRWK